jgi:hypothetical protein
VCFVGGKDQQDDQGVHRVSEKLPIIIRDDLAWCNDYLKQNEMEKAAQRRKLLNGNVIVNQTVN